MSNRKIRKRKAPTPAEVEAARKEAIRIRNEARLIKKETIEIIKKENPTDKSMWGPKGGILPGNKVPNSWKVAGNFSLKAMIRNKLQEIEPRNRKTYAELLINKMIKMAIVDGNEAQIRNILQYMEGMPKQTLEGSIDVKTALVSFIGGAIQGSSIKPLEEVQEVKQLENPEEIERNEDKEMEAIEGGHG